MFKSILKATLYNLKVSSFLYTAIVTNFILLIILTFWLITNALIVL